MKIILTGWRGSKKIISASSYLLNKYLSKEFDVYYLNYGEFSGDILMGQYVDLGDIDDSPQSWGKNLANYLSTLTDDYIILGDDDFFLSKKVNIDEFYKLFVFMNWYKNVCCVKLCNSSFHNLEEYDIVSGSICLLKETSPWTAVVQYCLWDREVLIELLRQCENPWEFETEGSRRLNKSGKRVIFSLNAPFIYSDGSALSRNQPGKVSILGIKKNDIENMIKLNYLNREELVYGMWRGHVEKYGDGSKNPYDCLADCQDGENVKNILDLCLRE